MKTTLTSFPNVNILTTKSSEYKKTNKLTNILTTNNDPFTTINFNSEKLKSEQRENDLREEKYIKDIENKIRINSGLSSIKNKRSKSFSISNKKIKKEYYTRSAHLVEIASEYMDKKQFEGKGYYNLKTVLKQSKNKDKDKDKETNKKNTNNNYSNNAKVISNITDITNQTDFDFKKIINEYNNSLIPLKVRKDLSLPKKPALDDKNNIYSQMISGRCNSAKNSRSNSKSNNFVFKQDVMLDSKSNKLKNSMNKLFREGIIIKELTKENNAYKQVKIKLLELKEIKENKAFLRHENNHYEVNINDLANKKGDKKDIIPLKDIRPINISLDIRSVSNKIVENELIINNFRKTTNNKTKVSLIKDVNIECQGS